MTDFLPLPCALLLIDLQRIIDAHARSLALLEGEYAQIVATAPALQWMESQ